MKEGQGVDEWLEGWMRAGILQSRRWNLEVGVAKIQLQSVGRLCHHFQGFLDLKDYLIVTMLSV